jgi:tetraacyldisaccharide 4'-kinase
MKKAFLYPLSLIFGLIVYLRNKLYDSKIFKSYEFDVPVISIGNITVGGTGKTPHTEYLVDLLRKQFNVVTVSRGYKRKTKGYKEVEVTSTALEVGDEPLQIKNKFNDIQVVVDEKRVHAINKLLSQDPVPDVILLDDAYQHRSVIPGINILLIDYNRPISTDWLLPYGRLREGKMQERRANIIIYTKCPSEIKPITRRLTMKEVHLRPYQSLYFTTMVYGDPVPVFPGEAPIVQSLLAGNQSILLIVGIAGPEHIQKYLESFTSDITVLKFPDHHNYSASDLNKMEQKFFELSSEKKLVITTEKDSMRLKDLDIPPVIRENLYYIPLKIKFLDSEGKSFDEKIVNYVRENKSNRELHKRKGKKAN